MVHFRMRFSDEDLGRIIKLLVQSGKEMLIEAVKNAAVATTQTIKSQTLMISCPLTT
jgi:hypothetical protein